MQTIYHRTRQKTSIQPCRQGTIWGLHGFRFQFEIDSVVKQECTCIVRHCLVNLSHQNCLWRISHTGHEWCVICPIMVPKWISRNVLGAFLVNLRNLQQHDCIRTPRPMSLTTVFVVWLVVKLLVQVNFSHHSSRNLERMATKASFTQTRFLDQGVVAVYLS